MLKIQFYSCFPPLSLATASMSPHLCFSSRKVSSLCLFIYVNIDMPMCMHAYIFLDVLALVFGTFLTSFLQDLLRRFLWVCLLSTLVASMASHCQTLVVWFPIFVCSLNCFPCGFFSMFAMGFLSSWNDKPTASCAFCFLRSLKWGVIFILFTWYPVQDYQQC